jgi:hypothetical protein
MECNPKVGTFEQLVKRCFVGVPTVHTLRFQTFDLIDRVNELDSRLLRQSLQRGREIARGDVHRPLGIGERRSAEQSGTY